MPIYEYKCSNCEHQFELIQKFSDQPAEICPECSQKSIQKLVSAPSFRLKGGGWYETDFKTGAKKNIVDTKEDKSNQSKKIKKTTDTSNSPSTKK
ncbi:zinc ribbon domain-containing protein [Gammaproteobacteria bacterium]|nr:zinc ribbon domain-containing protein [Gammaproteobacteria bacterium]MDA8925458.1 zinc ribbon domain-containing protein [Gammaproteobacteria bacterium]MDA9049027.1 zinc ribbon domain-containing protein [Gammaproteobacteria bacterium]MDA9153968.1 zinc ribbon domain-containing protein [Gammaproteobacteria bacterium]MDA9371395.1 zinc ribbon domain-containing protein [Gammaproteobacteria bacterium]